MGVKHVPTQHPPTHKRTHLMLTHVHTQCPVPVLDVRCSHCAPEDQEWQAVMQSVLGQEEAVLEAASKEG